MSITTISQLHPFADPRCLIENKPIKGLNGEKCIGAVPDEISQVTDELKIGFCLDFGHAICAAHSLKKEPLSFINELMRLHPVIYHLTDGDYKSEYDSHLHYGRGTFPLKDLLKLVPEDAKITNEAKHDSVTNLTDFKKDYEWITA